MGSCTGLVGCHWRGLQGVCGHVLHAAPWRRLATGVLCSSWLPGALGMHGVALHQQPALPSQRWPCKHPCSPVLVAHCTITLSFPSGTAQGQARQQLSGHALVHSACWLYWLIIGDWLQSSPDHAQKAISVLVGCQEVSPDPRQGTCHEPDAILSVARAAMLLMALHDVQSCESGHLRQRYTRYMLRWFWRHVPRWPHSDSCRAAQVHAYTAGPQGRTAYLSELQSGHEVIVVNAEGQQRSVIVGRVKIETRPLVTSTPLA